MFIIDNAWKKVAITNLVALFLTAIGMIHLPGILFTSGYEFKSNFIVTYSVCAVVFFIFHFIRFNQPAHPANEA